MTAKYWIFASSAVAVGMYIAGQSTIVPTSHNAIVSSVLVHSASVFHLALAGLGHGYRAAPALMLGLVAIVVIPVLASASRSISWAKRGPEATRRYRGKAVLPPNAAADIASEAVTLPGHASVEIVGADGAQFAILRDMFRIGREADNDIRIPSFAVHRYHAAIHRETFGDYRITDLSGIEGNGLVVNGQRCSDVQLADGDLIELGPGRLRFHGGLM